MAEKLRKRAETGIGLVGWRNVFRTATEREALAKLKAIGKPGWEYRIAVASAKARAHEAPKILRKSLKYAMEYIELDRKRDRPMRERLEKLLEKQVKELNGKMVEESQFTRTTEAYSTLMRSIVADAKGVETANRFIENLKMHYNQGFLALMGKD